MYKINKFNISKYYIDILELLLTCAVRIFILNGLSKIIYVHFRNKLGGVEEFLFTV